jgi:hypothetical protein
MFDKENAIDRVVIRVTEKEKKFLKDYAEKHGLGLTKLIKEALNQYINKEILTSDEFITVRQIIIDEFKRFRELKSEEDYLKELNNILVKLENYMNVPEKMRKGKKI